MQSLIKRNYPYRQINNFCPNERQLQRFVDALSTAINTKKQQQRQVTKATEERTQQQNTLRVLLATSEIFTGRTSASTGLKFGRWMHIIRMSKQKLSA